MSDPIVELNQLLYTATPSERRAILRAALPQFARWMVESVDACAEDQDAEALQWSLIVSTELLVPLGTAVDRLQTDATSAPGQGRRTPADPS